ncbi:MAG: penicillin-binding protein 2 [Bacteroidota bacterium]
MSFDPESQGGSKNRQRHFTIAVGVIFALVLLRLFTMQVLQGAKYRELSEENRIRVEVIAAPRGEIRDRNGVLLADNVPSFTVTLDPYDKTFTDSPALLDSTLERLGTILQVDPDLLRDKLERDGKQSFLPVRLKRNVDRTTVAYVAEHGSELPGVDVEFEPLRRYPMGEMASHLLGYVGEVSDKELDDPDKADYLSGDLIGKMGIERQYEHWLRGISGKRFVEVNAMGRKAALLGERRPVLPRRGDALTLTIDANLQRVAEQAFAPGARGAAVALDPRTGEVLALASKPNYDPNEFSTGISQARWSLLSEGGNFPLFNRAIQAAYPPGSTLKPFVGLAGLMTGAIQPGTTFRETCDGAFQFGRRSFKCWDPKGHGTLALHDAIERSCDVYFYQLGVRLGLDRLAAFMKKIQVSDKAGIDLPQERRGLFPDAVWYDRHYGAGRWSRGLVLNLAIGQGEIALTPVKLAQMTAMIANGGTLVRPHLVREVDEDGRSIPGAVPAESTGTHIEIPPDKAATIRAAMEAVVADPHGTGYAAKVDSVRVAGKTGTAQNPHGNDHALFICFAPVESPRIVIAVLVENAGHGSTAAAPIAQKMMQAFFHPAPAESLHVVASR